MAMQMESETIETLLQSLQLDKLIPVFNENDIDLELLMELSETELKELLTEVNLSIGHRYKIAKRLQKIKAGEKVELDKQSSPQVETNNANTGLKMTMWQESGTIETLLQSLELDTDDQTEIKGSRGKLKCEVAIADRKEQTETKGSLLKCPQCDVASRDAKDQSETTGPFENPKCKVADIDSNEKTESNRSLCSCPQCDVASRDAKDQSETTGPFENPKCEVTDIDAKGQSETTGPFENPKCEVADIDFCVLERKDVPKEEIRIVVIGKTGSGKSATGNTILNHNFFISYMSLRSITKFCFLNSVVRFGKKILLVDTPGIFDTDVSNEKTQKEIMKCIGITSPGPHAFIMVLSLGRFTEEEQKTIDHFVKYFGETVYEYFIVLFTRKDELDSDNVSFKSHLSNVPEPLQVFIEKCGGRAIAFNNKLKGDESDAQVKELLEMIEKNVKRNNGKFYTNRAYREAELEVQKMEEELLIKIREETEEKLKKLKKSRDRSSQSAIHALLGYKREREQNVRDDVRKDIEQNGFRRAFKYLRSWLPF